jgi:hypothetical protein
MMGASGMLQLHVVDLSPLPVIAPPKLGICELWQAFRRIRSFAASDFGGIIEGVTG